MREFRTRHKNTKERVLTHSQAWCDKTVGYYITPLYKRQEPENAVLEVGLEGPVGR